MNRSPERYLVYFILLTSVGSMLLIYGIAELTLDPVLSMVVFIIVLVLLVFAAILLFRRMNNS